MNILRKLIGRIVENIEVERRKTREEYEELREKYLSIGIILEDLYCYFEDRRCMDPEKKKIIKKLIDKYGYLEIEDEFWDWWDLAEDYNPEELRFLYEDY